MMKQSRRDQTQSKCQTIGAPTPAVAYFAAILVLFAVSPVAMATSPWTAQPAWSPPSQPSGSASHPTVGDLDGDGLPDLLFGTTAGSIVAYKNTGTVSSPAWTAQASWGIATLCNIAGGATNPQTYANPALADLDRDGKLDLLVATRDGVCIYQNTGTVNSPTWTLNTAWKGDLTNLTVNRMYNPALADLDGDGQVDLQLNYSGGLSWFKNTGSGNPFVPAWTQKSDWGPVSAGDTALSDLDASPDGLVDMMVADAFGDVFAFKNTGTATTPQWTFAPNWSPLTVGGTGSGIAFADVNGDGKVDLFYTTGTVTTIYQQDPAGMGPTGAASGPPPATGSTVSETFDSFACAGAWVLVSGTYYSRDCGNGWTAFSGGTDPGNTNIITSANVNGPSAAPATATGSALMYTAPSGDTRGDIWLLKTFPVQPGAVVSTAKADFRLKVAGGNLRDYYGFMVFDGTVTNPNLATTILNQNIAYDGDNGLTGDACDGVVTGNWCAWQTGVELGGFTPANSTITVGFYLSDVRLGQTNYAEFDNLIVSNVINVTAAALPVGDIAQLWKQDYQASGTNSGGQSSNDVAPKAVKTDAAGNVYVAGSANNGANHDILTIKYDAAGTLLWEKSYDGTDTDEAAALAVDGSGNVYVTGRSYNSVTGSYDFAVIKYDSNGLAQWTTKYDYLNRDDEPTGLAVDSSGNVYVTGSSCTSSLDCKYLTVKLDGSNGNTLWNAEYDNLGSSAVSTAVGIGLDSANNVYVSGTSSAGSDDIVTIKYDSAGTQLRVNRYDTGNEDRAVTMSTDAAGNVYIAGITFIGGNPTMVVLKYASAASGGTNQQQWVKTYNASYETLPAALTLDASGNVYVTGRAGNPGDFNWITVKYLSNGDVAWAQTFGNASLDDRATGVAVDALGNVYVVGTVTSSPGNSNLTLVKYDSSGVARNEISYDGYALNDAGVGIVLNVDSDGDTVPIVVGTSTDVAGLDHMVTVRYEKVLPDLSLTAVSGPSSATVGNAVAVANTVLNISDVANKKYRDSGAFTVGFYLAPNVGGLADLTNLTLIGTRSISNLTPGQSDAASTSVTIPTGVAEGSYFLVAKADSAGAVMEADETNNTLAAASPISITGVLPDLTVSSVSGPTSAVHGTPFNVTTTIANAVSTAASSAFRVGIYASTSSTVTTADTLIGSYTVASLAGNTSATATTSVTIPTSGSYYVAAIVDDQGAISEANESNNTGMLTAGVASSTLLVTKADFLAGLPGANVGVTVTNGAANVRLAQSPAWTAQAAWNMPGNVTSTARVALGDLNGDGLSDMLVGNYVGTLSAYQNTGTSAAPVWTAAPASWKTLGGTACESSMTYTAPAFFDLNGDGLLDLVMGTRNKVCVYQNTGSTTSPAWTRRTGWETGLTTLTTNRFYVPAVADLNGDGRGDILLGWSGSTALLAYRNSGTATVPAWTAQASWNAASGLTSATPALADLDGDGDYDLLVGNTNSGTVKAFKNTGTTSAPVWTANAAWDLASGVVTTAGTGVSLTDLNGDGSFDAMVSIDAGGTVKAFQNTGLFSSPGTYTSKVVDGGTHGTFTTLSYTAVIPSNTTLTVDIRAGNVATPDGTWTAWLTGIANGGDISALGTNQYLQYRFNFATTDTTVSASVFNIQANVQPPPATPIPVSVVAGGGSGGGELSAMDLWVMSLFFLFGQGLRRRTSIRL